MNDRSSDIFEINQVKKENNSNNLFADSNFFLTNDISVTKNKFANEAGRRLNDYDFNLLKEDAYKEVDDDVLKLEYKIFKTEEEIKNTNIQLQLANDISDYNLINDLTYRKKILEEDYEALIALYNNKSLSAKITENISKFLNSKYKTQINNINSSIGLLTEKIISKLPRQFTALIELKKSLNKLENINKSVDQLMAFNIPYGEQANKYEQLSEYIIKANSIQSEINGFF